MFRTLETMMQAAREFPRKVYALYADGFRSMTIGKVLWSIILLKLFVIFFIVRLFLMPNFLRENVAEGGEADYVARQLTEDLK